MKYFECVEGLISLLKRATIYWFLDHTQLFCGRMSSGRYIVCGMGGGLHLFLSFSFSLILSLSISLTLSLSLSPFLLSKKNLLLYLYFYNLSLLDRKP